ncbi:hypothetical protein KM799_05975 [Clostridium tyrobutyricum]|nr:hypothetical protein [Clostridium tyrobutyricum]
MYFLILMIALMTSGCSLIKSQTLKQATPPIPQATLDNIIKKYVEPISVKPSFGGKAFCDYKIIDSTKKYNMIDIYISLLGQEYYIKNNKLYEGTGGVFYAVLTIKEQNNNYNFVNCNISRAEEEEDSLKIFPEAVRKKLGKSSERNYFNNFSSNKIRKKAEAYFKMVKNS